MFLTILKVLNLGKILVGHILGFIAKLGQIGVTFVNKSILYIFLSGSKDLGNCCVLHYFPVAKGGTISLRYRGIKSLPTILFCKEV